MTSHGQRFRRRALRRGYKVDEVDAFLDRVEATLAGAPIDKPVTAQEVHDVTFRVRFGGYDEWQVDLHLDRVERQLAEAEQGRLGGERVASPLDRGAPPAPAPMSPPGPAPMSPPRPAPGPEAGYPPYEEPPTYGGYGPGEQGRHGRFDMTTEMHFDEPMAPAGPRPPMGPPAAPSMMSDATAEHVMPEMMPERGTGEHAPVRGAAAPTRGAASVARPPMGPPPSASPPMSPPPMSPPPMGPPPMGPPPMGPPTGGMATVGAADVTGPIPRPVSSDPVPPGYGPTTGEQPMPGPVLSADAQRVDQLRRTFQPRRFGSGYDRGQVDRLFEDIIAGLSGRVPLSVTVADLDPKRFDLVPGGYFEAEVENALNEVREILRRR